MKKLTLLLTTVALTAGIGLPAWSAMHLSSPSVGGALPALLDSGDAKGLLTLVDDGDDDENEGYGSKRAGKHDDDDDHGDDEDDDDDDDDDDCDDDDGSCGAGRNPAAAGSVAPPQNGLFEKGAAPQAVVK